MYWLGSSISRGPAGSSHTNQLVSWFVMNHLPKPGSNFVRSHTGSTGNISERDVDAQAQGRQPFFGVCANAPAAHHAIYPKKIVRNPYELERGKNLPCPNLRSCGSLRAPAYFALRVFGCVGNGAVTVPRFVLSKLLPPKRLWKSVDHSCVICPTCTLFLALLFDELSRRGTSQPNWPSARLFRYVGVSQPP